MLDLARIEAGKLDVAAVDTDLGALVRDVSAMFRQRAELAGLRFHSELAAPHPQLVRADDRRLRQILINLLGNAVKFTSAGEVRLAVRSTPLDSDQWRIVFEVTDTGIGIEADELQRIFDPFYQVAERNSEGIGLGLAITRRLVEAMGGQLNVNSEPRQRHDVHVHDGVPGRAGTSALAPAEPPSVKVIAGRRRTRARRRRPR